MQDGPSPWLQACTGMDIAADALARAAGKLTAAAQSQPSHTTQAPGQALPPQTSEGIPAGGSSPSEPGPSSAGTAACDSSHAHQQQQQQQQKQGPASLSPAAAPLSGSQQQESESATITHALPGVPTAGAQQPGAAALPAGSRLIGGPPHAAPGVSITLLQGNICAPELQLPGACPVPSARTSTAACCACRAVCMAVLLPPVAMTWHCNVLPSHTSPSGTCVAAGMKGTGLDWHQVWDQVAVQAAPMGMQGPLPSCSPQVWQS